MFWAGTFLGAAATAEAGPTPTPSPELQRLASSVGVWNTTQKYWSTPGAAVFESSGTERVRWSEDRQYLISEQSGLTPTGWTSRVTITSWNPADRQIHVIEVSPGGSILDLILWFEGDVVKVLGYRRFGDRLIRAEFTTEHISAGEFRFYTDCTDQEKRWVCTDGVSKRAK